MPKQILPNQKKKENRIPNDKYLTPYSIVQQLIDNIDLDKSETILEPCASSELTIGKVLRKNGFLSIEENIYDPNDEATDFLTQDRTTECIITNTPYGDKSITAFILKMKQVATKRIIALYPLSILQGIKRYTKIWTDKVFPLKEVLLFVRPPLLTDSVREDDKYLTGMTFYAWFIWEKGYEGAIQFRHINNHSFCLRQETKLPPP